jgi:hypothetical protein
MRRAAVAFGLAGLCACSPRSPANGGGADGGGPGGAEADGGGALADGTGAPDDRAVPPGADAASPGVATFVIGYNFGDATTTDATLDGHVLVATRPTDTATLRFRSSSGTVGGWPTAIANGSFVPGVDAEVGKVLNHHISAAGGGNLTIDQGLQNGTYAVYTYHLENNAATRSYTVAVQGSEVTQAPVNLAQYHWTKLGPFAAQVASGILTVELRGAQDSLIAGLEIFTTTGGTVQSLPTGPLPDSGAADSGGSDATTPPSSDGGVGPSPVDMTGWTMFFEDTFPGTSLDTSKWRMYGTCPSGTPPIYFNNDGIGVDNGFIGAIWSSGGQWYGPGIQSYAGEVYYRAEIKARVPKGNGLGPYFLMWPQTDEWPPEFDILEAPGDTGQVMTTWHWKDGGGNHQYSAQYYSCDRTQWHVYTVEHTAAGYKFWIDGVPQLTPAAWDENNDTTHVMNFGIGAVAFPDGSAWFGGIDETTPDPYHFYVEYVRMWSPN